MNGSRQRYRLDDYLQDKAQRAASPLSRGGASGLRQGMAVTPTGNATVQTAKPLPVRPPHTVQRPSGSSYNASNTSGGQDVTVDTLKPDAGTGAGGGVLTQSQMTTAYTKQLLENALANLVAMQNRKFKYDARSSPLYSIVQKQAEENARLASGRAFAQVKSATGGYGSSYAPLAADEAGRQAMRELDDQQFALYEAARAEFEAENASALEWYNTAKQLNEYAYLMEQDAKAQAVADGGMTQGASDAYNYILSLGESGWNGSNEETVRAMLNAQATAGGWTSEDVETAIGALKAGSSAQISDAVKQFEANPTLSGAEELWKVAKSQGVEGNYQKNISSTVSQALVDTMNDLENGYATLGVDQAAWANMTQEQQKSQLLERAAQYKKEGMLSASDFETILMDDVNDMVTAIESDEITKPASELSNMVITWKNYKDRGYISEEEYNSLLEKVTDKIDAAAAIKKQAATLGQHAGNLVGDVADSLNMSDWWKNFVKGAAKVHVGIVADYNPLSPTFIPSLLTNWKWVRKQILLNDDQEDAMEELLKAQEKKRGG